jgi:hypothetical protein
MNVAVTARGTVFEPRPHQKRGLLHEERRMHRVPLDCGITTGKGKTKKLVGERQKW